MKKIFKYYIITALIVLVILIPSLTVVLPRYYFVSVANGNSMYPTMTDNEICVFLISKDIKEGEIGLYNDGEDLVVHRVVHIQNGKYYFKGDNNDYVDAPVTKDQILGVLVFHIPAWKYNALFITIIIGSCSGVVFYTRKILRGDPK